ncbi:MAG: hypothetical protein GY699_14600 [Desulfobacteraceae bacterium]|nr:hypothetical protein [Desulfobacteraceae bacterium]
MSNCTIELLPTKAQISLSPSEWNVIAMFHRYPDLNTIAQKFNINEKQLGTVLDNLQIKKIVRVIDLEQGQDNVSVEIPSFFWESLEKELTHSVGPIASLLIDDKVREFSQDKAHFPHNMAYSLVEKIAAEIGSESERSQFQKKIMTLIKQYL